MYPEYTQLNINLYFLITKWHSLTCCKIMQNDNILIQQIYFKDS